MLRAIALWFQILADVLGIKLVAPQAEEGAAFGAAILTMVGVGAYKNLEAAFKILPPASDAVQPQQNSAYEAAFARYNPLHEALKTVRP